MGVVDTLTDRNDQFSREQFQAGMPLLPALRTLVLCCVDPRVDPASVLGIELGEAAILRNIGGRITPHVIGEITALRQLTEVIVGPLAPMQDLIVLQHNDCGILRLQEPPEVLATSSPSRRVPSVTSTSPTRLRQWPPTSVSCATTHTWRQHSG